MFISKWNKSETREYNEKVDHFKNLKNGKPNVFKEPTVEVRTWENDPNVDRKGVYKKEVINFQNKINQALNQTIPLVKALQSERFEPITSDEFTDLTEYKDMNKGDYIESIKEQKRTLRNVKNGIVKPSNVNDTFDSKNSKWESQNEPKTTRSDIADSSGTPSAEGTKK